MTAEDVRAAIRAGIDAFNAGDGRAAFFDAYAEEPVLHGYPSGIAGADGLRVFYEELWRALPDARIEIDEILVDGDRAALRYRLIGTHDGTYLGRPATGTAIDVEGLTVLRLDASGRIAEEWHSPTELAILRQLGAIKLLFGSGEPGDRLPPRASAAAEAAALRWEEQHDGE